MQRQIDIYSRTVGTSSASLGSRVFVLASNPAAGSGRELLFSDGLDFLDRGFKDQISSLAERVESSLTIVGKLRYSSRFSGSTYSFWVAVH